MSTEANISDDVIADTYANAQRDAMVTGIVAAYVGNNHVPMDDLPKLIAIVRTAMSEVTHEPESAVPAVEKATPAQIKKSITHDALISFEDGKSYKTLKRHLRMRGLDPSTYRAKWGLPHDYPIVAAGYSEQRSELARSMGLGQQQRAAPKAADTGSTVSDDPAPAKKPRKKAGDAA